MPQAFDTRQANHLRYRIISALMKGMTAQNALYGKIPAPPGTIALYGYESILRTRRYITAGRRQKW